MIKSHENQLGMKTQFNLRLTAELKDYIEVEAGFAGLSTTQFLVSLIEKDRFIKRAEFDLSRQKASPVKQPGQISTARSEEIGNLEIIIESLNEFVQAVSSKVAKHEEKLNKCEKTFQTISKELDELAGSVEVTEIVIPTMMNDIKTLKLMNLKPKTETSS